MKSLIYISLLSVALLFSCSDDDNNKEGNPTLDVKTELTSAMFGDSIPFKVEVYDDVPLSTLRAKLYFGETLVSEKVIRTKTNGEYEGKFFIPYLKDVPNGAAHLEFVLQNINFTISNKGYDLELTRPEYPYLTLVTEDKEYKMEYKGNYLYEIKTTFPQEVKGYIKTPTVSANGNELTFGVEDNNIMQGSDDDITFTNTSAGEYTISFNALTYAITPFIDVKVNGSSMQSVADGIFQLDLDLTKEQDLKIEGIGDFDTWWIDQDFFTKDGEQLKFTAIAGKYRISADFKLKYLKVEAMAGDKFAGLQDDGTGALWIIGDSQGKPSFANTGWDPNKATCMAPMGDHKYKISFVAGKTIIADRVNFVIFHVKDWGTSFKPETLSVKSDVIIIGEGQEINGVDKGNIALAKDKKLTVGKTYEFVVDASAGIDKAILTVTEK